MATHGTPTVSQSRGNAVAPVGEMTQWLLAGGLIGAVLVVVVFIVEGATRPDYSAWRNFVSQLSLSDQGWEQVANFIVFGALCIGFAFGVRRALGTGKGAVGGPVALGIMGLGLILAGIFPTGPALGYPNVPEAFTATHPRGIVHGLAGLATFVSLTVACFILARRFAGDPAWRGWALYSALTGVVVVVAFVASNVTSVLDMSGVMPDAPNGLLQRVAIIAGWSWIALLAARLLRGGSLAERGVEPAA